MTASGDGVSGRFVNRDGGEMRVDPKELDPSGCCSEPVVSGMSSDSLERVEGEITSGEKYSDECVDPAGEIVAVAGCGAGGGTGIGEGCVDDWGSWNGTVIVKPSVSCHMMEAMMR